MLCCRDPEHLIPSTGTIKANCYPDEGQPRNKGFMSTPQFFPIPRELHALACDAVNRQVAQLPFERDGIRVTEELIGVTLECLNAEFSKTLAITTKAVIASHMPEGLDRCLEQRLNIDGRPVSTVIAEILCRARIAEKTEVLDLSSHRKVRGIRLAQPWTWHEYSEPLKTVTTIADSGSSSVSLSWMNLCPVCRTGSLGHVSGKQLFGLPYTEYFVECSHCGAKFVPSGEQFRLVSIAALRDPLWKSNLDKTYPPETWSAIARNTERALQKPGKKPDRECSPEPGKKTRFGVFLPMKDGSGAVQCGQKTLYFKPARLIFSGGTKNDIFTWAQKSLQEILELAPYRHLREPVTARYSRYLSLRVGLFLWERKERHDIFYREFLNPYGDEKYGSFRMRECAEAAKKGIFLVVEEGKIVHAGCCDDSFRKTINDYLGRVSSHDCYLDGDSVRCRINSLLVARKKDAGIFLHCIENDQERLHIADTLGASSTGGTP